MVFYEAVDRLLATMYKASRDVEKRRALETIVADASRERGAYMNASFVWPLDFLFLNAAVYDVARLKALDERIERLAEELKVVCTRMQSSRQREDSFF